MKVELRSIESLTPYRGNPRVNDSAIAAVAASIKQFGFQQPIVVDKDYVIIAGHTRLKAARALGLLTVPVIVASDLTPDQVKAFRIADNRSAEFAKWDFDKLVVEIDGLSEPIKLELEALDLSGLLADAKVAIGPIPGLVDPDAVPEPPVEPVTQSGDLWLCGEHRILCGDSTKAEDVARVMGGETAALMVTDPPYGVSYEGGVANKAKRETLAGDDSTALFGSALARAVVAVPNGAWYVWHADRVAEPVYAAIRENGYEV